MRWPSKVNTCDCPNRAGAISRFGVSNLLQDVSSTRACLSTTQNLCPPAHCAAISLVFGFGMTHSHATGSERRQQGWGVAWLRTAPDRRISALLHYRGFVAVVYFYQVRHESARRSFLSRNEPNFQRFTY